MTVLDALSTSSRTKKVLAEMVGCTTREVELEINRLRLAGVWVVSTSDGYHLARSAAEVEDCARRLRQRAIGQLLTARALRSSARGTMQRSLGL